MLHYIHQNFLVAAKFIYSRIVNKQFQDTNIWVKNLGRVVEEKLIKPIKNKSEAVQMMRVNL